MPLAVAASPHPRTRCAHGRAGVLLWAVHRRARLNGSGAPGCGTAASHRRVGEGPPPAFSWVACVHDAPAGAGVPEDRYAWVAEYSRAMGARLSAPSAHRVAVTVVAGGTWMGTRAGYPYASGRSRRRGASPQATTRRHVGAVVVVLAAAVLLQAGEPSQVGGPGRGVCVREDDGPDAEGEGDAEEAAGAGAGPAGRARRVGGHGGAGPAGGARRVGGHGGDCKEKDGGLGYEPSGSQTSRRADRGSRARPARPGCVGMGHRSRRPIAA